LLEPCVWRAPRIVPDLPAPLRPFPAHRLATARFGLRGLMPVSLVARRFRTDEARALLAGAAAHTMLPLTAPATGAFAMMFMIVAHTVGWPVVEGGSARLVDAMTAELASHGGEVEPCRWCPSLP